MSAQKESDKQEWWLNAKEMKPIKKTVQLLAQYNLKTVDNLSQQLSVDFCLFFLYRAEEIEPDPSKPNVFDSCPVGRIPPGVPATLFYNTTEPPTLELESYWINFHTGEVIALVDWIITVQETLELERFPFDRQLFTLQALFPDSRVVQWTRGIEGLPQVVHHMVNSPLLVSMVAEADVWDIGHYRGVFVNDNSQLNISITAERKPFFYVWNVMMVLFFIVLSSVFGLSIPDASGRLSFMVTLLLTAVAFKLVITSLVPKVSYFTFLDWHNFACFLSLVVIMAKDFIILYVTNVYHQRFDRIFMGTFAGAAVLFHLILVLGAARRWFVKPWSWEVVNKEQRAPVMLRSNFNVTMSVNDGNVPFDESTSVVAVK